MSPSKTPIKNITILGGGISGILLRTCLSRLSLPGLHIVMYDRQPTRHAGGPVQFHPWALEPLTRFLGVDESNFRKEVQMNLFRGDSQDQTSKTEGKGSIWVDRTKLHRFCTGLIQQWEGKDPIIKEGKVSHVEFQDSLDEGGTSSTTSGKQGGSTVNESERHSSSLSSPETRKGVVKVTISDSKNTQHQQLTVPLDGILIAAEGVHSVTRQNLCPDSKLQILPYATFNGRRDLSVDEYHQSYQQFFQNTDNNDGYVLEKRIDNEGVLLQIKIVPGRKELELNYVFSRPASKSREEDALFRPKRDKEEATTIPEEFYDEIHNLDGLDGVWKMVFDPEKMRRDRILNWLMRDHLVDRSQLDEVLEKMGVVMVGEAVHSTPILGSVGANHAALDAVFFAQAFGEGGKDGLKRFYEQRYGEWDKGLKEGERRIEEMHRGDGNRKGLEASL